MIKLLRFLEVASYSLAIIFFVYFKINGDNTNAYFLVVLFLSLAIYFRLSIYAELRPKVKRGSKPVEKEPEEKEPEPSESDLELGCQVYLSTMLRKTYQGKKALWLYDFKVKGASFEGRYYKLLDIYWKLSNKVMPREWYRGLSNEEIASSSRSDGKRCHQLNFAQQKTPEVKIIPEPNNPYDKNALAVYVMDTMVGYVPRDETDAVRSWTSDYYALEAEILGGQFKYWNDEKQVLATDISPHFGVEITIYTLEDFDDPDFTKLTPQEEKDLEEALKEDTFYTHEEVWD